MPASPQINTTSYRGIFTTHATKREELAQAVESGAYPAVADVLLANLFVFPPGHGLAAHFPGWLVDMGAAEADAANVPVETVFYVAWRIVQERLSFESAFDIVIVGTAEQTAATLDAAEILAVVILGLDLPMASSALVFEAYLSGLEALPPQDRERVVAVLQKHLSVGGGFHDQVDAASVGALRYAAEHVVGSDSPAQKVRTDEIPGWIRLGAFDAVTAWANGTARTCMCSPSLDRPQPVVAAAWLPGLVTCTRCVHLFHGLSAVEELTCDGCGHVCSETELSDGIHRTAVNCGPLTYVAGVCSRCAADLPYVESA
jgi:hypothetical protein